MASRVLERQLEKVLNILRAAAPEFDPASSHTKGRAREAFVDKYLARVLPPAMRVSNGDIIDSSDNASGHCDIIIESRFAPRVPNPMGAEDTLHVCEGVACVIEVKSNVEAQWAEVDDKARRVKRLTRALWGAVTRYDTDYEHVPIYAVGYRGWKTMAHARRRVDDKTVDGVLVLDSALFVSRHFTASGPHALWAFAWSLMLDATATMELSPNVSAYTDEVAASLQPPNVE